MDVTGVVGEGWGHLRVAGVFGIAGAGPQGSRMKRGYPQCMRSWPFMTREFRQSYAPITGRTMPFRAAKRR